MKLLRLAGLLAALAALHPSAATDTSDDSSELVLLVSLSRHGSRAPNPITKKLCPNNLPNMKAYEVPPEQLTERGMQQLEAAGRHVRELYVDDMKFLSPSFNGKTHEHFEAYFRADSANRCGQSAISMGFGLYPDGTGPKGYGKQPIPVYMQLEENEHDFTAEGACWDMLQQDNKNYGAGRGHDSIVKNIDILQRAAKICGTEFYDGKQGEGSIAAIKDVSDMFLFDADQELPPTPGLTPELTFELSKLAFQHLIERLYTYPRQITYEVGGFPELLMRNLNSAAVPGFDPDSATKYYSYHGHRELLHGLGFMMGYKFNFAGLPEYNGSTPLIPGTTLFFELHRTPSAAGDGNAPPQHFVRLFVWSPKTPRTPIKLPACALDCPLDEFNAILNAHLALTGTWRDVCNYHPVFHPPTQPALRQESAMGSPSASSRAWQWIWPTAILIAVGAVSALAYQRFLRRREYQPL
ncbi:hypothetical protein PINS_up003576 [Pythium insidiosum]|nr:hypothetical protein PINS_up003576 [Pythium insidiosum]